MRQNLDILYDSYNPAEFTKTIVSVLDDRKLDNVIDQLLTRGLISKDDLKKPVQTSTRECGIKPVPGVDSHAVTVCTVTESSSLEGAVGGLCIEGQCRQELSSQPSCSFDNRNPIVTKGNQPCVVLPRAELENPDDDEEEAEAEETELKTSVTSKPDNFRESSL